jgi:hypothetical protein
MILVRLLSYLRQHWPYTHILVRGDSHVATPEVLDGMCPTFYTWHFCQGCAARSVPHAS